MPHPLLADFTRQAGEQAGFRAGLRASSWDGQKMTYYKDQLLQAPSRMRTDSRPKEIRALDIKQENEEARARQKKAKLDIKREQEKGVGKAAQAAERKRQAEDLEAKSKPQAAESKKEQHYRMTTAKTLERDRNIGERAMATAAAGGYIHGLSYHVPGASSQGAAYPVTTSQRAASTMRCSSTFEHGSGFSRDMHASLPPINPVQPATAQGAPRPEPYYDQYRQQYVGHEYGTGGTGSSQSGYPNLLSSSAYGRPPVAPLPPNPYLSSSPAYQQPRNQESSSQQPPAARAPSRSWSDVMIGNVEAKDERSHRHRERQ